ncbi:MAG TPA: guanylate kinase [Firmicutes bacterium]|nr:guanylate kinase [Bacillota bacterium]
MRKGFLVIVSAPSGGGKTTICLNLLKRNPDLVYSVSATTRPIRGSEKDGKDYFFLSEDEFKKRISRNLFAEWAVVHNNYYGTPRKFVEDNIKSGRVVICDIDVQGGEKIMAVFPEAVKVFIIPPTWEDLERRLRSRGTDTEEVILRRLRNARKELKYIKKYRYCITNESVRQSVNDLEDIIHAELLTVGRIDNNHSFLRKER